MEQMGYPGLDTPEDELEADLDELLEFDPDDELLDLEDDESGIDWDAGDRAHEQALGRLARRRP